MKKSKYFPLKAGWLAFIALLVLTISVAYAAPMPPRTVVNHKTRQCTQITPGDECGDVILPPDWEYLDPSLGENCPDNYTKVEIQFEWMQFKSQMCCSEGHSGSKGDCKDVVTQPKSRQCAFVEDIQNCPSLPEGWQAWGQNCPVDFYWTGDVACKSDESIPTLNATSVIQTEPASSNQPTATPPADQTAGSADVRNPLCPCASFGLAFIALCSFALRRR